MLQNTNLGDADAFSLKQAADSLEKRIELGEPRATESVLNAYPALATNRDSVLELMYLEWVLRCERDELPNVKEYFERFPEFASDFEKLVRVDEVVRGAIPESGITLAEKAAIDFDPLTVEAREVVSSRPSSLHSISIGGYTLERIIGRGGMGIVYQARQHQLDRLVALKTIDFAGSLNPRTVARFRSEAELVARLQHPNIVQVYETGSHSGMPFFSMELVDGGTLATAIASSAMKPQLAAKLVEVLSRAMHYAHSQGIVHRDLKPANVLLARSDRAEALDFSNASSGASGPIRYEPKIVDFGLAKLLGDTSSRTVSGTALGTPSYMAPEQLSSEFGEIGPASDVYSLGAILYELLVGHPPFHAATAVETMQQVRNDEPVVPKSLRRKLPSDLVLICLTCLQKEPQQRYATAADLANDLQRYLSGNSIQARPPNIFESGLKWTKRHPSATALIASITLATIGMTMLWLRAERSSIAERFERVRAESLVYARNISLAHFEFRSNKGEECKRLLALCPAHQRNWEWRYLDALCDDALWVSPRSKLMAGALDMSLDGRFVAIGQAEWGIDTHEPISVWDIATGKKVWELPGHHGGTYSVCFSPDGKSLVSSGVVWDKDETKGSGGGIKVWNLEDGTERFDLSDKNAFVVRYNPSGTSIFAGLSSGVVVEYASDSGKEIVQHRLAQQFIADLTFHSNGRLCAACSRDGRVVVWDITVNKPSQVYALNLPDPRRITWQPGTNILIVSCFGGAIKKFEFSDRKLELLDTQGHNAVPIIAYSPDGQYLATSVFGERTVISEVKTGKTINLLRGHNGHVRALTFDASGQRIATSGNDGSVRVWDLKRHIDYPQQRYISRFQVHSMAAHPTKPEIAVVNGYNRRRPQPLEEGEDYSVVVFNVETRGEREIKTQHSNWLTSAAYSQDGAILLTSSLDGSINCIDRKSTKVLRVLQGHIAPVVSVAWIDQERAISIDSNGTAMIWHVETGNALSSWDTHHNSVMSLLVDSKHNRAFVVDHNGALSLWGLPHPSLHSDSTKVEPPNDKRSTAQLLQRHDLHLEPTAFAVSADAKHMAVADSTGNVRLWLVSQLLGRNLIEPKHTLNCHADRITSLAFSPDGTRLLSSSRDESIKLIDVQNGYELIELDRAKGANPIVLFTSDGSQVLRAEGEKLWSWAIKPRVDPSSISSDNAHSSAIAWHRKQRAIASASESWFAAQFHNTELLALEPNKIEHLKDRATSRTYMLDFAGAEADLRSAISLDPKFELQVALARIQLRQGKQAEYRKTCEQLYQHSLLALVRAKNYEMAWVCCLSPDSGVDFKAILTVLDATRVVNTPVESLPDRIPLLDSALSVFRNEDETGDSPKKRQVSGTKDFNDSTYALACYRAGKYALAEKHARTATRGLNGTQHVDHLTIAMSQAKLGKLKEARVALGDAKKWIAHYEGLNKSGSAENQPRDAATVKRQLNVLRTTAVEYPILLSEAEKLLAEMRDK